MLCQRTNTKEIAGQSAFRRVGKLTDKHVSNTRFLYGLNVIFFSLIHQYM